MPECDHLRWQLCVSLAENQSQLPAETNAGSPSCGRAALGLFKCRKPAGVIRDLCSSPSAADVLVA